ncbi:MAG: site-specific integrase [Flavobacteriales bacterium]
MRILFWLYKSKKNAALQSPVWVRITINGDRDQFATGIHVPENQWNSGAQKLEGRGKLVESLNQQLHLVRQKLQEVYCHLLTLDDLVTPKDIRRTYFGDDSNSKKLLEVYELHNTKIAELVGIKYTDSTLRIFRSNIKILQHYIKDEYNMNDIPLRKLDRKFIENYAHFMFAEKKFANATTFKNLKRLGKIVNFAINNNWLDDRPFKGYRFKQERKEIEYLSEEELKIIETKTLHVDRLERVRDYFVFQCYTGLSYIDLKTLKKEQIRPGVDGELWIFGARVKTGTSFRVPVLPKAQAIMDKYRDDGEMALNIPSNQRFNGYLKEIAAICGVNKVLHTHLARKTFCTTVTLLNGVPLETITALVGHSSIKVTERVYAKVLDEKVSRDMHVLKERLCHNMK